MNALITICARAGSKGVPSKNIRPLLGKPLIAHSIELAKAWKHPRIKKTTTIVSTDGEQIADAARAAGADVPFLRPKELATDTAGKIPALTHAIKAAEDHYREKFDVVVDLDPTAPVRGHEDLSNGLDCFLKSPVDVAFSVTKARKNPYFNMVEETESGHAKLVKALPSAVASRQAAPKVWDMNASIYVYSPAFLRSGPAGLWSGTARFFEMDELTAYDIDTELDFEIVSMILERARKHQ